MIYYKMIYFFHNVLELDTPHNQQMVQVERGGRGKLMPTDLDNVFFSHFGSFKHFDHTKSDQVRNRKGSSVSYNVKLGVDSCRHFIIGL